MNKMIRRMLSMALCLCLIVAMTVPVFAASNTYQGTYNGQGFMATSTATGDHFKGVIGSTSTYAMRVKVTYDYVGTDGLHERNVINSVEKTAEAKIERSIINGYYTGTLKFEYFMNGTNVHTEYITV